MSGAGLADHDTAKAGTELKIGLFAERLVDVVPPDVIAIFEAACRR